MSQRRMAPSRQVYPVPAYSGSETPTSIKEADGIRATACARAHTKEYVFLEEDTLVTMFLVTGIDKARPCENPSSDSKRHDIV